MDTKLLEAPITQEYKVGNPVLLETPGILRKLSTPRTGPYFVTNTIRIRKKLFQKG
jgi:hypothetical protein